MKGQASLPVQNEMTSYLRQKTSPTEPPGCAEAHVTFKRYMHVFAHRAKCINLIVSMGVIPHPTAHLLPSHHWIRERCGLGEVLLSNAL
eukprot:5548871-Amphidinium_carterae.1